MTALVGISDTDQLDQAARAAARGPLPAEAISLLDRIWSALAEERAG